MPFIGAMYRSVITRRGRHSWKLVRAFRPSAAVRTLYPSIDNKRRKAFAMTGSSSTTRTRDLSASVVINPPRSNGQTTDQARGGNLLAKTRVSVRKRTHLCSHSHQPKWLTHQ